MGGLGFKFDMSKGNKYTIKFKRVEKWRYLMQLTCTVLNLVGFNYLEIRHPPIKLNAPLLINTCAITALRAFRYVLLRALQVLSIFLSLHFSLQNNGGLITWHIQGSDGS